MPYEILTRRLADALPRPQLLPARPLPGRVIRVDVDRYVQFVTVRMHPPNTETRDSLLALVLRIRRISVTEFQSEGRGLCNQKSQAKSPLNFLSVTEPCFSNGIHVLSNGHQANAVLH